MASNFQPHLRWLGLGDLTSQTSVAFSVSLLRCTPAALSSTHLAHPDLWDILASWPQHQGLGSFGDVWKLAPLHDGDTNFELAGRAVRELAAPLYALIRDRAAELQDDIIHGGSFAAAALDGSMDAHDRNVARYSHTLHCMGVLDCVLATIFSGSGLAEPSVRGSGLAEPSVIPLQVDHSFPQEIQADDRRLKKYYEAGILKWKETLKNFCRTWEAHVADLEQSDAAAPASDNAAVSLLRASNAAHHKKRFATNEMNLYDVAVALQVLSSVSRADI